MESRPYWPGGCEGVQDREGHRRWTDRARRVVLEPAPKVSRAQTHIPPTPAPAGPTGPAPLDMGLPRAAAGYPV